MAETRYTTFDNVSPTQKQLQNEDMKIPSSAFDFGCIHSTTGFVGALIPVDCFDVVPRENISISMTNFLEFRNPTTRPLLNGFRVYFHAYYNKLTDLWEGAKNFLDTGLSGSVSLSRPKLIFSADDYAGDYAFKVNACTPLSLMAYLGVSSNVYQSSVTTSHFDTGKLPPLYWFRTANDLSRDGYNDHYTEINKIDDFYPADCFFAYQRNWRDYYANRNLLQNNKFWFPDNENHFILSYSCEEAVCVDYENETLSNESDRLINLLGAATNIDDDFYKHTLEPNNPTTVTPPGGFTPQYAPNLAGLKFRQFRGDRFNTALPFPDLIRGDIPLISLNGQSVKAEILLDSGETLSPINASTVNVTSSKITVTDSAEIEGDYANGTLGVKIPVSQITQNALRALETFTVFKERNARISGKDSFYNGFIEAQFGYNPHTHDSRGIYLGGFYQDFALSAVTQTSQSTESSPLGQKSGQGISNGGGTICSNFTTSDFGWIQIYMSIVPEMYYTQGKPRMFSKKTQLDMYFPLFNNLEPQAILNKELFLSGTSATDNDVFAYEDRYAEYKSRPNRVSGLLALPHSIAEYDASRIMARRFTSTPVLNNNFVSMIPENIDMSVFSVMDEPPFDVSCAISVRRVFPGPYTAIPGSLSSQIHA